MTSRQYSAVQRQTIALAAVAQTASLVDQLATGGRCSEAARVASVKSLFCFDADSIEDIFGGLEKLDLGLTVLAEILGSQIGNDKREVIRYLFNLTFLERRFSDRPQMIDAVHNQLQRIARSHSDIDGQIESVCREVAQLYQETLGTLKHRITVTGSASHLQNPVHADAIRTLLLAGIRATFLWRQVGGRRWRLLLGRRHVRTAAQELLQQLRVREKIHEHSIHNRSTE